MEAISSSTATASKHHAINWLDAEDPFNLGGQKPQFPLMHGAPYDDYYDFKLELHTLLSMPSSSNDVDESGRKTATKRRKDGWNFPSEIIDRIISYFTVRPVDHGETKATACSSTSDHHELSSCLVDDTDSWWISAMFSGINSRGHGKEWVEFRLSPTHVLRRVSALNISIPPLPQGPLSVRTLRIEALNTLGEWYDATPSLLVESRSGWQRLTFDSFDAHTVRIACLTNQASRFLSDSDGGLDERMLFAGIGFYAVRFE